jgi:hypothetical protein
MKPKTNIGQVFLLHPRDENYSAVYEESFLKHGETVQLFAVMEIAPESGGNLSKLNRREYEKLAQILVATFKKTYVTAPILDQDTFEKSLAAINIALSRIISRGRVNWFGRLNAVACAFRQNQLAVSATGNALSYLVRKNDWTALSEGLTEEAVRPLKIFSNYSSGRLISGDRVILSTKQLFNYLSLDRLREFFAEDTLEETCHEAINALADIKNTSFAAFIFEIGSGVAVPKAEKPKLPLAEPSLSFWHYSWRTLGFIFKILWLVFTKIIGGIRASLNHLFRKKTKKYLFAAIGLVIIILLANLGLTSWKKNTRKTQEANVSNLSAAAGKLNEAEAALIYNDESRAISLLQETEKLLSQTSLDANSSKQDLENKLAALKNKINKEIRVDNPTLLTTFPNIPTSLLHSPNGFLGFNRNSLSLAFYDFRTGKTEALFKSENLSSLAAGDYVGGTHGYVFYQKEGKLKKLDLATQQILDYEGDPKILDGPAAKIQTVKTLGEGSSARLYLLDTKQKQIWRVQMTENQPKPAAAWLKAPQDSLAEAIDMAIDSSIYLLFPDRIEKYFNGQSQEFKLSPVDPLLSDASKIYSQAEFKNLYVLDPKNGRILVFDKQGKLQNQIRSDKFHDLRDFYIDEKNNLLQVLAGSELLQVSLGK